MAKQENKGITVKKSEDFSEWYNEVVIKGDLAEHSPIRGFMVIKPNGYALWESIQFFFDAYIKKIGVKNAYFPLLIPENFFKKEAEHAEGFAPELAWVQEKEDGGKLAIRPTSETIMYDSYAKWIRSWRDLPLRMNQWCNVLRWEVKQTKLFLRTREFLWQEGHCVYETEADCEKETKLYLKGYQDVCEKLLGIAVIPGEKTSAEKFAGAKTTYALEALMPDGKALQMGTSHNLGQSFAKAFGISYLDRNEKRAVPWQNSWGISTRMIGAVVMSHADDKGLILPPKMAPTEVVIVPIYKKDSQDAVLKKCAEIKRSLSNFKVELDDRDGYSPGWKFSEWELKGVPIRVEVGPKDIEQDQAVAVRRDTGEKENVSLKNLNARIKSMLENMQNSLYDKSKQQLESNLATAKTYKEFEKHIADKKMVLVPFSCDEKHEAEIKEKTGGVTSRVIPFDQPKELPPCFYSGKEAKCWVYFAKAY